MRRFALDHIIIVINVCLYTWTWPNASSLDVISTKYSVSKILRPVVVIIIYQLFYLRINHKV